MLLIFAVAYFLVTLPMSQYLSKRYRGRKFVIRLGTPWRFSDPEQRWDVFLSLVSFMTALAVAMFILDSIYPFANAGR